MAIAPEDVTHVFYHTLVVDPSKAFNPDLDGYAGWQQWMTTISEFDEITQEMYDRGYVLVSIHDLIKKTTNEDGSVTIEPNNIYLPEGKKAFVLSLDDLCYYHTYDKSWGRHQRLFWMRMASLPVSMCRMTVPW